MQKLKKNNQGFTIIEVVLVLAIAGLIFLIVFLALPRLQRNRRDTQRKTDVGTVLSQLEQYAGNHNGTYPTATGGGGAAEFPAFQTAYLQNLNDPDGTAYAVTYNGAPLGATHSIRYAAPGNCVNGVYTPGGTPREVAVEMRLESGTVCQDN